MLYVTAGVSVIWKLHIHAKYELECITHENENAATPILIVAISRNRALKFRSLLLKYNNWTQR